jgi:hypothetical protein
MSVPLDLYTASPQELFIGLLFCVGIVVAAIGIVVAVVLLVSAKKDQRPGDGDVRS